MALRIRLSRGGAKKRPFYRIVVADSRFPRDGRFIERVGSYNPMVVKDHPDRIVLKEERIRHWIGVGALPSDRVARFLGEAGIIAMPAISEKPKKSLPKAKAQERMKEAAEAAAAAAAAPAAAEAPAEEAAAQEESAAEEAAAEGESPAEEAAAEGESPAEAPAEEAAAAEAPAEPEAAPADDSAAEEKPAEEAPEEEQKG